MRRVRSRDTAPELALRRAIWRLGGRYALHLDDLPGKPDIVFRRARLAVFVDGDMWHGGQWSKRGHASLEDQFRGSNRAYWVAKIRRNMSRDLQVTASLLRMGWAVLRIWESSLKRDVDFFASLILTMIKNGAVSSPYASVPELTTAEFFAGIGLMRMGLESEGWRVLYANDIDPEKLSQYDAHFRDAADHYALGDIHEVDPTTVPTVTLATASFPCTDLSLAGARKGLKGDQSSAFWGFINVLSAMKERRPPMLLIENVIGFLTSHGGDDFRSAMLALNALGYQVDAFIVDAVHFVPQSRQRLFVVGSLHAPGDYDNVNGVLSLLQPTANRPKLLIDFINRNRDIAWKVRPLPVIESSCATLADVLEDLPLDSPEWWNEKRSSYLLAQMSPRHAELANRLISDSRWTYGTVFRRTRNGKSMAELRVDGIAGCLRTPKGGSARQILFKAGYGQYHVRLVTPREAARLMGADDFTIEGPANRALFGFGDAVCVPVVGWIARHYLNPMTTELIHDAPLVQGEIAEMP